MDPPGLDFRRVAPPPHPGVSRAPVPPVSGAEGFTEDCPSNKNGPVVFSAQGCIDPHLALVDCAMEDMQTALFATFAPAGDLSASCASRGAVWGLSSL